MEISIAPDAGVGSHDVEASPPTTEDERERRIEAVHAEIGEVCGHLNALHGRLVALTADMLTNDLWRQSGIRSPEHWATWQVGVSAATARRLVNAARRHRELPATMAALAAGELSRRLPTPARQPPRQPARQPHRPDHGYRHRPPTRTSPVLPEPEPALDPTTPHDAHGPIDPHRADTTGTSVDLADLDTTDPERFAAATASTTPSTSTTNSSIPTAPAFRPGSAT